MRLVGELAVHKARVTFKRSEFNNALSQLLAGLLAMTVGIDAKEEAFVPLNLQHVPGRPGETLVFSGYLYMSQGDEWGFTHLVLAQRYETQSTLYTLVVLELTERAEDVDRRKDIWQARQAIYVGQKADIDALRDDGMLWAALELN